MRTASLKPKKKRKKKKSTTISMMRGNTNLMKWVNNLRGTNSRFKRPPVLKRGHGAKSRLAAKRALSVNQKRKKKGTVIKKKKKKALGTKKKKKGLGTKKKKKKIVKKKKKKTKSKKTKLKKSLPSTQF